MIKISKNKRDIQIICEVLVKKSPFVLSCELHGNPKLGCGWYHNEMVNPSWVWPARIELTNGEVHFGCFVFDENTNTASFGDEKFYRWKEKKEDFCYFDNTKQVAFYPGANPKTETFYDDAFICEFSFSTNDVRDILKIFVNSLHANADVKNVVFKIKQGNPYYIAEVTVDEKTVYYEMPVGLAYHSNLLNAATLIKEIPSKEFDNSKLYQEPKVGMTYILSEDAIPQNKTLIGSCLIPVEFCGNNFKLISFSSAKFTCFELCGHV